MTTDTRTRSLARTLVFLFVSGVLIGTALGVILGLGITS